MRRERLGGLLNFLRWAAGWMEGMTKSTFRDAGPEVLQGCVGVTEGGLKAMAAADEDAAVE